MLVGSHIKAFRIGRGMTVAALAAQTGLSKGLISQIENDKTSPSLATLDRIAQGLDVPVSYLLLRPADGIQVVRAAERAIYQHGPDQLRVEVLSGRTARNLKAVVVEFPPGTNTGCEPHSHGGEEFHFVLEGTVEAFSGRDKVKLEVGDSFHWRGCTPHRIVNVGDGTARILAVTSGSVGELIGEE